MKIRVKISIKIGNRKYSAGEIVEAESLLAQKLIAQNMAERVPPETIKSPEDKKADVADVK